MIDFPDAPTPGQEFTVGGMTWVWNDPVWNIKAARPAATLPHAAAWLTATLDLPLGTTGQGNINPILFQGSETSDPSIISYDAATGKFTLHKAGRYQISYRMMQQVVSTNYTPGVNGHMAQMEARTANAHASGLWGAATIYTPGSLPALFSYSDTAHGMVTLRLPAGQEVWAKIDYRSPDLVGQPANGIATGKTTLQAKQQTGGGNRATGMEILRIGD
jgi:hypothetical protein